MEDKGGKRVKRRKKGIVLLFGGGSRVGLNPNSNGEGDGSKYAK